MDLEAISAASADRPENCSRRRGARLLQGARRDLSRHIAPAALGAEDRERLGQGPTLSAGRHEEGSARSLLGAEQGVGRSGDRCLRREIPCKNAAGGRMPHQGSLSALAFNDFPAEHWDHLRTTDEMDKRFLHDGDDGSGNRCKPILLFGRARGSFLRLGHRSRGRPRARAVKAGHICGHRTAWL